MTSYEEEDNFPDGDYGSVPKYQQFQVNFIFNHKDKVYCGLTRKFCFSL